MNKQPLSLFSRLYLSVVLTVIFSGTITAFVAEIYNEQEEIDFFIYDVNYIFEHLQHSGRLIETDNREEIKLPFPLERDFSAQLVNTELNPNYCQSCQFIKRFNNINYYELEDGERLAEFSLALASNKLLIYEQIDNERSKEELLALELDDHNDQILFLLLIIITSVFLALIIYWPIKNLQTQIKSLIRSHQVFGEGNMTMKADENIQKPLDELAASFNKMAQAISDNVKERDTFSQAIPHEVRTPLSRIQLASGLIRKKSTDSDILALVDDVDNYVTDINDLISQIVEFSRINDSKAKEIAQYQTIIIKDFVASRLDLLANNKQHRLIVDIEQSVVITTNPFYLRLLVDNFIKNALNHGQEKIKFSAEIENNQLSIIVEDDGIGVPVSDRETIFIPFARLDKSRSRKTGGLGLGLPIAKAAASKMAGKIVVSSSPLGGAMFSFTTDV